ncbi:MAG: CehA/McbA family metallohydrolase [Anaerolineales bacterium]
MLSKALNPRAEWYRGDFHAHTSYSDGEHTPAQLVGVAIAEGLDFFAVTDHNTIEAFPEFGEQKEMLVIPGLEVTLKDGYFNVFGMEGWLDWIEHVHTGENTIEWTGIYWTTTALMQRTSSQRLLNSINHPLLPWEPPWSGATGHGARWAPLAVE